MLFLSFYRSLEHYRTIVNFNKLKCFVVDNKKSKSESLNIIEVI